MFVNIKISSSYERVNMPQRLSDLLKFLKNVLFICFCLLFFHITWWLLAWLECLVAVVIQDLVAVETATPLESSWRLPSVTASSEPVQYQNITKHFELIKFKSALEFSL